MMDATRRRVITAAMAGAAALAAPIALRADAQARGVAALAGWTRLALELVRHTPTFSPPVASRAFACLHVAAWEAARPADGASLAGQLHALAPLPPAPPGADPAVALHAALAAMAAHLFANTGPTGQRALRALTARLGADAGAGAAPTAAAAGAAHGAAVAAHVIAWAAEDGGAIIENLGFPLSHALGSGPAAWAPTGAAALQQAPLLPGWGANRPFALPDGAACPVAPPPAYSADPASAFFAEAREVHAVSAALSDEQRRIARFWADDAMLSPTPPGHWIAIAAQALDAADMALDRRLDVLARVAVAMADAFIVCWRDKYRHDLLRPVTYIRRHIDPGWSPLIDTPPFPEYPSGHSVQSAAAAAVLTAALGEGFAFTDATHADDGLPPRRFPSFRAAADEAALSRLYGGIHFRAAVERGQAQGACVARHALALRLLA